MSSSLLAAFRQVRLNGQILTTSAGHIQLGSDLTVMASETGQFASSAGLAALDARLVQSGANLAAQIAGLSAGNYMHVTGDETISGIKNFSTQLQRSGSNVLTENQSGQFASAASVTLLNALTTLLNTNINTVSGRVVALSGTMVADYVAKASQVILNTIIPTGIDTYFIPFGVTFGIVPKVQASVEVTGDVMYLCGVRNRTVSGYTVIFSDTIFENGVSVNTFASI